MDLITAGSVPQKAQLQCYKSFSFCEIFFNK